MAIRTSASDIFEILPDGISMEDSAVEAYIEIASGIVDEIDSTVLSTDRLKEIERWLTAHLIMITKDRQATTREKLGDAEVSYANIFGEGLKATTYGQMVMQLDTTGTLSNLGKKTISIKAITSFE